MTLEEILQTSTLALDKEKAEDRWDDENRVSYSADGRKLLDAEGFPSEVWVEQGCEILCDEVFAFQDYMADTPLGQEIPLEERNSFLEKIHLLYIGDEAFCDCWQLERITLPAGVKVIGERAFQGCINLYQIRLGRELEVIGEDAFDDCESLETILIPHGMLDFFLTLLPKELHECIEEL